MAIVCKGYDGVLTEVDWAQMASMQGGMPSVRGIHDFKCTVHVVDVNVNVTVNAGAAWAHGVMCTMNTQDTVSGTLPGPGYTRFDYVVLTRDWSTNSAFLEIVRGGSVDSPKSVLTSQPGVKHQQLLATMKLTSNGVDTVYDRRIIGGRFGYGRDLGSDYDPQGGDIVVNNSGVGQLFDGNTWNTIIPHIETGSKSAAFAGSHVYSYSISFSKPFSTPPVVVASMATAAGGTQNIDVKTYSVTTTGFRLAFITNDGSKVSDVTAVANWVAVGS